MGESTATNASTCAWIGKPHEPNLLYQSFWNEGCVFYARTTQPQTIMHLETESNIYGRTDNPYNRNLTPGGSSGGEGALIGMRGSLVVCLDRSSLYLVLFSDTSRVSAATSAAAFDAQQLTAASTLSSK
jgi:hypothetical protein